MHDAGFEGPVRTKVAMAAGWDLDTRWSIVSKVNRWCRSNNEGKYIEGSDLHGCVSAQAVHQSAEGNVC